MRLKRIMYLLSVLFLLLVGQGRAAYDCVFEHLSTDDGLSHGSVSAMIKDNYGFMWFATWDGINRYDGHTFKTFKPGDGKGSNTASNRIETIKVDYLGNIWIINYDSKAFRFNHLSEEFDAVPVSLGSIALDVSDIYPVLSGDVWVSTSNSGVFRVVADSITNRFRIDKYNEESEISLPGNSIHFVVEDVERNIWISTNKGLTCFEYNANKTSLAPKVFSSATNELLKRYSVSYFYNISSHIFIGTNEGSVFVYDLSNGEMHEIAFQNNRPISNIIGDYNGVLFFSTKGNGIFKYDELVGEITAHYQHSDILNVLNTYADSKGMLWIESAKAGIAKIDISNGNYKHYQQILGVNQDMRSNAQCGLMEDEHHTIWMTLKGGGFGFYNPETDNVDYFFNKPGDPQSKVSNFVNCFYKDPSGVLWMSTYFKGIEKITFIQKDFKFVQPAPQAKLSIANEVRALLEDSRGYLWVASKNEELFLLDKDYSIIKKIDQLNGGAIGRIYTMLEDTHGNIYLGSKGNGLFKLTRKGPFDFNVQHYLHDPNDSSSLSNNNIYSLLEDKKGRIWIGTYGGGVNLLINNRFLNRNKGLKKYPAHNGDKVRCIAQNDDGTIWMGSTDGIIRLKPENDLPSDFEFHFYNKENGNTNGLLSNDIFWIFCDRQNTVWMASLGGGLSQLKHNKAGAEILEFSTYTKADGLSSDMVFTITDDEDGNLWMSTENGIAFYDQKQQAFRNYSQYDGIVNAGFSEAALAIRADGSICFGANNGLYSFQPSNFKTEQKKVAIVFTGFQLFGKEALPGDDSVLKETITETSAIKLKYNQNVFGITWAGLDFKMQDKFKYAYMLDGFDNDWRSAGELYQANYTKVPPGKYIFKVKFNNPELQTYNTPKLLAIDISPPIWKTNLAYILYLILAIGLVEITRRIITSMIRLRNKVVIEKELTNIKLNFFTNISHELRTPLTLIVGPAKELRTKEKLSKKGLIYTELIELNAQRLLRLVNQLLDFRKIQSGKMELQLKEVEMVSFIRKVCHNFDELARENDISYSVTSSENSLIALIDVEKMDSVLFNVLSNAFKFTPKAGAIEVLISHVMAVNKLQIEVRDSGIGIPKEQIDTLFKVFASHQNNSESKNVGTGIGLALSKELVELHGGELFYKPTPGGGATFVIEMDGVDNPNKIALQDTVDRIGVDTLIVQSDDSHIESSSLPCILIVEDNQDLRSFLNLQLNDEYLIYEAVNGRDGLAQALKIQPDIILSDVMMPEMDGIQLLEEIKNNFETSHIPVVLLTAKSSVESKIEGLKYGADAYMTKPFHSEQLKAQLENLLNQRVLLRERYAQQNEHDERTNNLGLTDRDALFLDQVRLIIETNLTNTTFKIEDIYTQVNMGRSKFFVKLKGLTGLPPVDFVKEYRMNKAQSLLKTGEYNVTETSYLSGFTDAGYFSKCYKEHFGISPSQVGKK